VYPTRRSLGISVAFTLVVGALGPREAQAQPASALSIESRAQAFYQQGRERFSAGDFEQARLAFQSSLDTVDSPNTRMYLGRTLLRLGRPADAWVLLDRAARDAEARAASEPRYVPTRDAARAEADAIAPSLAWLTVAAPDAPRDLSVRVNGAPLHQGGLGVTIPMEPGDVTITASAVGRRDVLTSLTLAAGQRELRTLVLEALPAPAPLAVEAPLILPPPPRALPPAPDRTELRVAGLVLGVFGAAVAVAGGGLLYARDRAEQDLVSGGYNAARVEDGKLFQDLGYGLLVPGAVLAATGAVMYFVGRASPGASRAVTLHASPAGLGGTF